MIGCLPRTALSTASSVRNLVCVAGLRERGASVAPGCARHPLSRRHGVVPGHRQLAKPGAGAVPQVESQSHAVVRPPFCDASCYCYAGSLVPQTPPPQGR